MLSRIEISIGLRNLGLEKNGNRERRTMDKTFRLMNYTTEVPAEKSVYDAERLLAKAGASRVLKDYSGDGRVTGFIFEIPTDSGDLLIKLPVDVEKVFTFLMASKKKLHHDTKKRVRIQAERIAWRILVDSLSADLTRLALKQVTPEQIFLAHIYNACSRTTFFERLVKDGLKQLGTGNEGV